MLKQRYRTECLELFGCYRLLCAKPTFIVGTPEDLGDYLSTFDAHADPAPPGSLVLTIPSSAFESIRFPSKLTEGDNPETDKEDEESNAEHTPKTDRAVWETNRKGQAHHVMKQFGEKLVQARKEVQANENVALVEARKRNCPTNNCSARCGDIPERLVLEEMPVHIICSNIQLNGTIRP